MRLPKALTLLPLTLFAIPALAAGNCVLQETCFEGQPCEAAEMTLAWASGSVHKIWMNGEELQSASIKAGEFKDEIRTADTTSKIVNSNDMIWASNGSLTLGIAHKDQSSTVTATLMQVRAHRYVDYDGAIARRQVFSGTCEGLF